MRSIYQYKKRIMRKIGSILVLLLLSLSSCNVTSDIITSNKGKESDLVESQSFSESSTSTTTINPLTPSSTPTPTLLPTVGYKPQLWTIYSHADIDLKSPDTSISVFYIYDIEETESGVMWFASTYGLVRFDGQAWELVKSETGITNIAFVEESPSGEIWFTISDGIYSLGEEVIQKRMNFDDFEVDIFDVTGLSVSTNGYVWVSLKNGIWFFNGVDWNMPESDIELPFKNITSIVIDDYGVVYTWGIVAKSELVVNDPRYHSYGGLSYYDGNKWIFFDDREQYGLPAEPMFMFFAEQLVLDKQNNIWFYLWREGLFEYTGEEFVLHVPYDDNNYNPESYGFDQSGTLWLGDWSEGVQLFKYVPGSEGFQTIDGSFNLFFENAYGEPVLYWYEYKDILPFQYVTALHVDSNNDLWIATEHGVYVFDIDMD